MVKRLDKVYKKAEIANQAFWDEIAPIHYKSYDIEKLKQRKSLIDEIQKKERGSVKDKFLLHLQCHRGLYNWKVKEISQKQIKEE